MEVTKILSNITGSCNKVELVEDKVYISDQYNLYPLSDLCTRAREQVLLALRIGIAPRIIGGELLFIILDNALQHSDRDRRENLVKQIINLAKKVWQVTYLSMDDHIRDLFLKHGKSIFKKVHLLRT